jgi:hypothetical protein
MVELEDRRGRIAARVLDRAADETRLCREPDRLGRDFGRVAEALLQVGGDWQVGGVANHPRLGQRLIARDPAVTPAQHAGRRAARGCQCRKPEPGHHPRRAAIPDIGDDECLRGLVQRTELLCLVRLGHGHPESPSPSGCWPSAPRPEGHAANRNQIQTRRGNVAPSATK